MWLSVVTLGGDLRWVVERAFVRGRDTIGGLSGDASGVLPRFGQHERSICVCAGNGESQHCFEPLCGCSGDDTLS